MSFQHIAVLPTTSAITSTPCCGLNRTRKKIVGVLPIRNELAILSPPCCHSRLRLPVCDFCSFPRPCALNSVQYQQRYGSAHLLPSKLTVHRRYRLSPLTVASQHSRFVQSPSNRHTYSAVCWTRVNSLLLADAFLQQHILSPLASCIRPIDFQASPVAA